MQIKSHCKQKKKKVKNKIFRQINAKIQIW